MKIWSISLLTNAIYLKICAFSSVWVWSFIVSETHKLKNVIIEGFRSSELEGVVGPILQQITLRNSTVNLSLHICCVQIWKSQKSRWVGSQRQRVPLTYFKISLASGYDRMSFLIERIKVSVVVELHLYLNSMCSIEGCQFS